jgi:hypothetical protein
MKKDLNHVINNVMIHMDVVEDKKRRRTEIKKNIVPPKYEEPAKVTFVQSSKFALLDAEDEGAEGPDNSAEGPDNSEEVGNEQDS